MGKSQGKIHSPVGIIGRGRCGTSALAGALSAGGWKFPGEQPPQKVLKDSTRQWVPGYLEVRKIPAKGNYKHTGAPIVPRGDETLILMVRDLEEHIAAIQYALQPNQEDSQILRALLRYNAEALRHNPIVIRFEDLMEHPREVLSMFADLELEKASEFIKPTKSIFYARNKKD